MATLFPPTVIQAGDSGVGHDIAHVTRRGEAAPHFEHLVHTYVGGDSYVFRLENRDTASWI